MAVLGRQAILQAVDDGLIAITPFSADHVGPCIGGPHPRLHVSGVPQGA
jgi:hypothetical protein